MTPVDRPHTRPGLLLAELSLLIVHLAVVVGFGRLYDGNDHLLDLVTFTVVAHVAAGVTRHLRVPLVAAYAVGLGGAVLVATWLLFPDTVFAGLPTASTLDAARTAIDVAAEEFRTVAAPTAPLPGFQLLAGLALWAAAWFADWAAFRLRATAEAMAPATILFVFCTVLGSGGSRFSSAVLFAGAVVLFVANHRSHLAELDNAWLATSPADGARWVRRAALGVGATIVVTGAVAAPFVPGFDDEAVVTWRNRDTTGGLRTTVSPIVDLRRRLVTQSNREMFRVQSNVPSYWRLTSLHEFDGKIWSSGGEYGEAVDQLPTSGELSDETQLITQTIRVQALAAIWVPAAFQARLLLERNRGLSWDPDSATLIVDSDSESSDGLEYTITSERPVLEPGRLARATGDDPGEVTDRYLSLPGDFPSLAVTQAQTATAGATNRYEQAKALQDYFQDGSFTYTTDIDPGHDNDALVSFLEERRGYCEQFAGAYAAMARSLGIPARVAVGFTEGDRDPNDPWTFQVRGVHAHAWPEVYFPEHGWVPFEPTPGRGIPGAESYTGLAPDQEQSAETQPTVSVVTTSTTAPAAPTSPTSVTRPEEVPVRGTNFNPSPAEEPDRWSTFVRWGVGLGAAWIALVLAAPRIRALARRRPGTDGAVLSAWDEALDPIRWVTRLRPRSSETHAEFSRRAAHALELQAGPVAELAELAERAAWDPTPVSPADAGRADELAARIRAELRDREPVARRVRRRLSWREAFGLNSAGRGPVGGTGSDLPTRETASATEREPERVG